MENINKNSQEKLTAFTLRKATAEDLPFLFRVSTEAMQPVDDALNPDKKVSGEEEFENYKNKFKPEEIEIIQYGGEDVGRLRVEYRTDSIYVGGIQILPEFQNKGIGTAIFTKLIEESKAKNIPITLEVHDVNINALNFYKKLGFEESGKEALKTLMKFVPTK